jgi:hypothetical protein
MNLKKIHITEAKAIAERIGADAVVVLAFNGDVVAGASYGRTKKLCDLAGKCMDILINVINEWWGDGTSPRR